MGRPEEKELQDTLDNFSNVLQKFGLDIITKLGQNNSKIQTLTDKVDQLNEATISIKGLIPNLNRIIENQDKVMKELDLIRSLILKSSTGSTPVSDEIDKDSLLLDKKDSIKQKLSNFATKLNSMNTIREIRENLDNVKTEIFELTGGHKILHEILQTINGLRNENVDLATTKKEIAEKIAFWKNRV